MPNWGVSTQLHWLKADVENIGPLKKDLTCSEVQRRVSGNVTYWLHADLDK